MALNIAGLAGEMKTAIESAYGKPADDSATLQKFCDAVSEAVINHIKANAVVNTNMTTGLVTTGAGTGGTVTGPAVGTIT